MVYFAQTRDDDLLQCASRAAARLNLPLRVEYIGYGALETRLVALMARHSA